MEAMARSSQIGLRYAMQTQSGFQLKSDFTCLI